MRSTLAGSSIAAAILLSVTTCVPVSSDPVRAVAPAVAAKTPPVPVAEWTPEPPPEVTVDDTLRDGVVIVISNASQHMHVFQDGRLWRSSPVSTGKRGKETPTGVFAILQKRRFHRSNLYSNAPMPFMQRLTWDGIAIHAGRLPGYPASHGCIRLPSNFANDLFRLTGFTSTGVIVTNDPLEDEAAALRLAQRTDAVIPIDPKLLEETPMRVATAEHESKFGPPQAATPAPERTPVPEPLSDTQAIQFAAALSDGEARAHWERISKAHPELAKMQMQVVPARVNGRQYYRLRAASPDAHAACAKLSSTGLECFPVG
ncbi:L,D-transpeptidase family protein [Erythrobacter litoralis]|uniref:L,D-TPase catalytic domain-containing protein n=1 Tax=Erythrobacter litoralis (strain HTCC2594) TaxID=314225 RepID=Q2NAL0_ERYLH|nr:L,D-transpeptidase family protein [Erythrobacter litoralis]ABC63281.1 hypothetical protein ELI_05945 [Erythrobacter litoralis HTCC2594]